PSRRRRRQHSPRLRRWESRHSKKLGGHKIGHNTKEYQSGIGTKLLVRKGGLEPPRFYPPDPKCCVLLVRATGVEPASPCGHKVLSLARLPVPPRPHCFGLDLGTICPNPDFEFSKFLRCFRYIF